jgi:hypothetical protein
VKTQALTYPEPNTPFNIKMPIDFQLSPSEDGIRKAAAGFAATVLKDAKRTYLQYTHHYERFQSTRPIYRKAVEAGLIKGQVPPPLGGTGGTLVEAAILVEEMYAVEPAASLTIFATGLGLTPLVLTGKPEHKEFLEPFLNGQGEPLASLVFSEPGGVANYLEKGAPGLDTIAQQDGDEWVINGEKVRYILRHICKPQESKSLRGEAFAHLQRVLTERESNRSGLPTVLAGTSRVQICNASSAVQPHPAPTSLRPAS